MLLDKRVEHEQPGGVVEVVLRPVKAYSAASCWMTDRATAGSQPTPTGMLPSRTFVEIVAMPWSERFGSIPSWSMISRMNRWVQLPVVTPTSSPSRSVGSLTDDPEGTKQRLHCWPCENPATATRSIGVSSFASAVIDGMSPV
ncbi:hypothetical protein [Halalkalicoccus subterraneus]|uniref:hypothetical protein n=1 Tax=Halalkalicoccus subterraneus TaxID=2675002 RepID=UPI001FE84645|nr:hypothetical protein [Halalkalicoccus subterraneus]